MLTVTQPGSWPTSRGASPTIVSSRPSSLAVRVRCVNGDSPSVPSGWRPSSYAPTAPRSVVVPGFVLVRIHAKLLLSNVQSSALLLGVKMVALTIAQSSLDIGP